MKTTLTHDEVCHALVDYIARDSDGRIIGTPTLFISTNDANQIVSCNLYFEIEEKQSLSDQYLNDFDIKI